MTDDIALAILAELQALRSAVGALQASIDGRAPAPAPDALLRAIRASWGPEFFTARELLLFARRPGASALRLGLRTAGVADSARSLGKLLASIEGKDAGGMTVTRVGDDRNCVLWKVCEFAASNSQAHLTC